MEQKIEEVS